MTFAPRQGEDHEYDYEYDDTETETFLVELDLSNANTVKEPSVTRNFLNPSRKRKMAEDGLLEDDESASDTDEVKGRSRNKFNKVHHADKKLKPPPSNFQLLDLKTTEPLVSYDEQIYSCSWIDTIGTSIFLGRSNHKSPAKLVQSTPEYSITGASRIRLLGERTQMPRVIPQKTSSGEEEGMASVTNPGFSQCSKQHQTEVKQQANFLERLMDVKRRQGDQDIITAFPDQQAAPLSVADEGSDVVTRRQESGDLNERAVSGDAEAISQLSSLRYTREQSPFDATLTDSVRPP